MYAKLFTSIYQGTLRGNSHGLLVFTNLLAHCDKSGVVDMHPRAIAEEVGLTVEQVRVALDELESVDAESRSPENDGRRIIRLDEHRSWGWTVVNYVKYRSIRDEEDRREQNRLSQERWRHKHGKPPSAAVSQDKPQSAHTEAEADTGKPIASAAKASATKRGSRLPEGWMLPKAWGEWALAEFTGWTAETVRLEAAKFADFWHAKAGRDAAKLDWCATWRNWCRNATPSKATLPVTVPGPEVWKPEAPLSEAEMAAQAELRRKAVSAIKRVS